MMETNLITSGKNEVIYIKKGLGHRIGDKIYMHEDLKNYPLLHSYVYNHELGHTVDASLSYKDLTNEMTLNIFSLFNLMMFSMVRPSTWSDLLPINYNKQGGFIIDKSMMVLYGIGLVAIVLLFIIF